MAREHPREGDERLSGRDNMPPGNNSDASPSEGGLAKRAKGDHLGRALKSVYDDTLREDVPDEFKDLLGKLK
ncbi:NepR family anti-sigma factor [Sphingomicrobium nitratireducens]|uniref:NepR family anti-sigma factor n=1 Tax=Sphingomicrobium nitratireducens TaxID=2964666 RepID=UPI0022401C44|nr:NepR family anti-sigma factor [Sphingomicrobium nitratireducens]